MSDRSFVASLVSHTDSVFSVAFSPDGQRLASGSADQTVKIWNVSRRLLERTLTGHTFFVSSVDLSPDGTLLASASDDTTARLWRSGDGAEVATLAEHPDGPSQVAFSPDGALLATVGFGPGGRTLVTTGNDRILRVWRVSDGALLATNSTGRPQGLVEMSPDNTVAAVPAQNGVRLYDASTGAQVRILGGSATSESPLSFSPNGKFLAIGVQQFGANIQVVNVSDGSIQTLKGDPEGFMQGVAFTPDSAKVIAGSGFSRRLQIWDVATGDPLATYDQEIGWGPFVRLPINTSLTAGLYAYGRGDGPVSVAENPF